MKNLLNNGNTFIHSLSQQICNMLLLYARHYLSSAWSNKGVKAWLHLQSVHSTEEKTDNKAEHLRVPQENVPQPPSPLFLS